MTRSSLITMTALGKWLHETFLKVVNDCCHDTVECPLSFCRATFDRIAEININIDAGQDTVSLYELICHINCFLNIFNCLNFIAVTKPVGRTCESCITFIRHGRFLSKVEAA